MDEPNRCPECGADLQPGQSCDELFARVLGWEHRGAPETYACHHLLVMAWELQHPSRFTEPALEWVRTSLRRSLRDGVTAQRLLSESRDAFQQTRRTWKVTRHGVQPVLRRWPRTIADVVAEGPGALPESIRRMADATLEALESAGEVESHARSV